MPPFDKRQLKAEFIKSLGDNILTGYKRKKLKDLNISNSTAEDHNNATTLESKCSYSFFYCYVFIIYLVMSEVLIVVTDVF